MSYYLRLHITGPDGSSTVVNATSSMVANREQAEGLETVVRREAGKRGITKIEIIEADGERADAVVRLVQRKERTAARARRVGSKTLDTLESGQDSAGRAVVGAVQFLRMARDSERNSVVEQHGREFDYQDEA